MWLEGTILDGMAVEGLTQPTSVYENNQGFGAGSSHETLLSPFILQMNWLGFRDVELPSITTILRVKAQSLSSDLQFLSSSPSVFFMLLCPFLYVLILGGCSQLSVEIGALTKWGPLEKAWPDLHKTVGPGKIVGHIYYGISPWNSNRRWYWVQWSICLFLVWALLE